MNRLDRLYFNWLVSKVCTAVDKQKYSELMKYLYFKEFVWLNEFDENCAQYGVALENDFLEDSITGRSLINSYEFSFSGCSILALLVSLSRDIEREIMTNDEFGDRTGKWFWVMIRNLGLIKYTDERWNEDEVDEKIEEFLDSGIIFKEKCDKNVRHIWAQITNYLSDFAIKDGEIW